MIRNSSRRIFFFTENRLPSSTILAPMRRTVISCSRHHMHVWHCHIFKSNYRHVQFEGFESVSVIAKWQERGASDDIGK